MGMRKKASLIIQGEGWKCHINNPLFKTNKNIKFLLNFVKKSNYQAFLLIYSIKNNFSKNL
jgi:hypothetical protein